MCYNTMPQLNLRSTTLSLYLPHKKINFKNMLDKKISPYSVSVNTQRKQPIDLFSLIYFLAYRIFSLGFFVWISYPSLNGG
jgi:cytoskeletal protein RodZ